MSNERNSDRTEKPVKFREYPKVVFLWPIAAAALLISLGAWVWPGGFVQKQVDPDQITHQETRDLLVEYNNNTGKLVNRGWGNFFFILFFMNVLVLAYDFDLTKGAAAFFGAVALGLLVLYLSTQFKDLWPWLSDLVGRVRIVMNLHFMWAMALVGILTACAIALHASFNWWELTHNELIHRKRFLGDIKRYPAQHCRLSKEIPDVMEYFFYFGCGRLVFQIPGEQRAFVLEHVPFVDRREREIKEKLGSLSIRHESPDYDPEPGI